jgi:hypothetical protein
MKTQEALLWQRPNYTYEVTKEWSFHGKPDLTQSIEIEVSFTSNSEHFSQINFVSGEGIYYDEVQVYSGETGLWLNNAY